ncbi:MAG: hypothetical protein J6Z30_05150 [Pyramidobacter sp.]|nr:hypothetical protein [Pyramidobacter sp.]
MNGAYDLHFHIGPEVIARRFDALGTARSLEADGMAGAVLKNHYYSTVPFAKMAWDQGAENVWGSLVLNWYAGGLNPFAVRGSLGLKAKGHSLFKVLWMPTVHAAAHLRVRAALGSRYDVPPEWTGGAVLGTPISRIPPIDVRAPEVQEPLKEILRIVAGEGLILATGHVSREEVFHLVPLARDLGVEKIILTHPIYETTKLSVADIRALTAPGGVWAEQSYALIPIDGQTPARIAEYIRGVGAEHTILSTDLGQASRQTSGEGMKLLRELLAAEGVTKADLDLMSVSNPKKLLDV